MATTGALPNVISVLLAEAGGGVGVGGGVVGGVTGNVCLGVATTGASPNVTSILADFVALLLGTSVCRGGGSCVGIL